MYISFYFLLLFVVIIAFIFFNISSQLKKARLKSSNDWEKITILYEEIYIADKLTGFINSLEFLSEKYKTPNIKLADCVLDLKDCVKAIEASKGWNIGRDLVVLEKEESQKELNLLLIKVKPPKGR